MTNVTCACCDLAKSNTVALHCRPDVALCPDCLDWLVRRSRKQARGAGGVRVVSTDPVFLVADVARARNHYERLGFTTDQHDDTYAFAHRDDLVLHLEQSDGRATAGEVYLHVSDAAQLAEDWRRAGVEVVGPEDFDYGKREGSHVDPDGNVIRFGSPIPD
jgi:catechol 2,3-dioxygenase-like lactoylglutathione lyase family enzyme